MKLIKDEPPAELIRPTTPPKLATPVTSSSSFESTTQTGASPPRAMPSSAAASRYNDPFAGSSQFPSQSSRYYNYSTTAPSSDVRYNNPFVAQQQQIFQVRFLKFLFGKRYNLIKASGACSRESTNSVVSSWRTLDFEQCVFCKLKTFQLIIVAKSMFKFQFNIFMSLKLPRVHFCSKKQIEVKLKLKQKVSKNIWKNLFKLSSKKMLFYEGSRINTKYILLLIFFFHKNCL